TGAGIYARERSASPKAHRRYRRLRRDSPAALRESLGYCEHLVSLASPCDSSRLTTLASDAIRPAWQPLKWQECSTGVRPIRRRRRPAPSPGQGGTQYVRKSFRRRRWVTTRSLGLKLSTTRFL